MSVGKGTRPDLAARNRSPENRKRVAASQRGVPKPYRCGPEAKPVGERLEKRSTTLPTGCRVWRGSLDRDGYGSLEVRGKRVRVHRASYELSKGPIPPGLQIDHLCRIRHCINPDHMEPVTTRTNVLRGVAPTALNALKTRCKRGHPFSASNTLSLSGGRRGCRTCRNAQALSRYHQKKAA